MDDPSPRRLPYLFRTDAVHARSARAVEEVRQGVSIFCFSCVITDFVVSRRKSVMALTCFHVARYFNTSRGFFSRSTRATRTPAFHLVAKRLCGPGKETKYRPLNGARYTEFGSSDARTLIYPRLSVDDPSLALP